MFSIKSRLYTMNPKCGPGACMHGVYIRKDIFISMLGANFRTAYIRGRFCWEFHRSSENLKAY